MLRDFLPWLAGFRPLRVIMAETPDANGVDVGLVEGGETPLFERYFLAEIPRWIPKLGGGAVYLHHYLRSDPDRGVHDHPWDHALAVQLAGGYVEERFAGVSPQGLRKSYTARKPGRGYLLRGSDFHRVLTDSRPATSWSLFAHGPYRKGWGFLSDPDHGRPDPAALPLPAAQGVNDSGVILTFRPFKNENDGSSKWWLTAKKGRDQARADAFGQLHPEPVEGRGLDAAARADARLRAQLKVARETGLL